MRKHGVRISAKTNIIRLRAKTFTTTYANINIQLKVAPPLAKSLSFITSVPHLAHTFIHLSSKFGFLQNAIIFNINVVAIPHIEHTTDRIYIEIMLRLMTMKANSGRFLGRYATPSHCVINQ